MCVCVTSVSVCEMPALHVHDVAVTFEDLTSDHDEDVHIGFPVLQSEAMGRYLRQEFVQHGDQILRLSLAAEGQWPLPGNSSMVRGSLPTGR